MISSLSIQPPRISHKNIAEDQVNQTKEISGIAQPVFVKKKEEPRTLEFFGIGFSGTRFEIKRKILFYIQHKNNIQNDIIEAFTGEKYTEFYQQFPLSDFLEAI